MAAHSTLTASLNTRADRALNRLNQLKAYLASVAGIPLQTGTAHSLSREARASAVVCTVAELEALTRDLLVMTHTEINAAAMEHRHLRRCLRQLVAHDLFEGLRHLQDHAKLWESRLIATTLDVSTVSASFPIARKGPQPPLDGKTLTPAHFYRIWQIYGLPGNAFPVVSWATSLQKLALMRNDIAHANFAFRDIFAHAGRTAADVERYLDDMTLFAIHLTIQWSEYLDTQQYLAVNAPP